MELWHYVAGQFFMSLESAGWSETGEMHFSCPKSRKLEGNLSFGENGLPVSGNMCFVQILRKKSQKEKNIAKQEKIVYSEITGYGSGAIKKWPDGRYAGGQTGFEEDRQEAGGYMQRNRKRMSPKKMSPVTVVGAVVLTTVLCGTFGYKQYVLGVQKTEYAAQIRELQKQKRNLALEREDLRTFADYVKTDEYAEEVAREKLGLVHKGEILFVPENK